MERGTRFRRGNRFVRRLFSAVLACVLLFSTVGITAQAAGGTKKTVTRAIGIVYDNSGSMYVNGNMAWCRAMYAIEVFASMMNEGDTLQIYPMYELTANGKSYTSQKPCTVSGGGDISVIRELLTPRAGDTPIETIGDAYSGLQKTSADEKWLIVLTDGDEFYENGTPLGGNTKTRLSEVLTQCNQGVNVLYLGIGSVAVMPEVTGSGIYQYKADKASNSADVLSKLTDMCNMIFGRDALSSSGNQLSFDVSMKKLIVFVQGSDINGVTLKNSSGASVGSPTLEYTPRYSEQGASAGIGQNGFGIDRSLSGTVAVYDMELAAGTYSLSYSGNASNVSVYYEPDVDLMATLTDEYGAKVDPSGDLYPGTYTMTYGMMDKNETPTNSSLLGKTDYAVTYSVNGVDKTVTSDKSGQIELDLNEGDTLDAEITVTYLSGYTITKNASDFGWPDGGLHIVARPAGFLEARVSGGQNVFKLSELEDTPYTVTLLYEGEPLTGEQLDATEVFVTIEGGNAGYKLTPNGDGYELGLRYAGTAADTDCGDYVMRVSAAYTDEFDVTARSDESEIAFAIEDDGGALSIDVDGDRYYVISKLDDNEGILVTLYLDGQKLTDEQLAAVTLTVDADGLSYTAVPQSGQSAYRVKLVKDDNAAPGKYTLNFTATMPDQVGREISAREDKTITLNTYPLWLKLLVGFLILLLLLALIYAYLNMKVLPKKILINGAQTVFLVDGELIPGNATCKFTGGGKKTGSLKITSPNYAASPLVTGGVTLTLQAVSPRRTKSSRRRMRVTKVSPANTTALQSMQIVSHTLAKTEDMDGVIWMYDGQQIPSASAAPAFEIGSKPDFTYMGTAQTGEEFTLKVVLQSK